MHGWYGYNNTNICTCNMLLFANSLRKILDKGLLFFRFLPMSLKFIRFFFLRTLLIMTLWRLIRYLILKLVFIFIYEVMHKQHSGSFDHDTLMLYNAFDLMLLSLFFLAILKPNSWFAIFLFFFGNLSRLRVTLFDVQTLNMQRRWYLLLMPCEWEVIPLVVLWHALWGTVHV